MTDMPTTKVTIPVTQEGGPVPADELLNLASTQEDRPAVGPIINGVLRRLNVRPDPLDFRDLMYEATLVEVPTISDMNQYLGVGVPVLDQGEEGACTGAALATIAHYLFRIRKVVRDDTPVSMRMFYEMAKRYDEYEGTDYSGSSARGAMKGWHKHGVCSEELWRYAPNDVQGVLNDDRARDAANRPLGAYYRVDHTNLVAMHTAIAEVGILYASGNVHNGWTHVDGSGEIPFVSGTIGAHAFAIVGYDRNGFWIQNSWGTAWGKSGLGHITYDDWVANGTDVWVARLGVPVALNTSESVARLQIRTSQTSEALTHADLRPHVISIGNNGQLRPGGRFGTSPAAVAEIFNNDFQKITEKWQKRRLLLYAHGGLVDEDGALQRIADYRQIFLAEEIYPLAFIWHSDYWTTLLNILRDAQAKRRPEGFFGSAKDFLLDRADDMLEPLARVASGKAEWDEMKENALSATTSASGGARIVASHLPALAANGIEIHIVGHSAGAVFHAPLVQHLGELGVKIASCTLWAAACTMELFHKTYEPAINSGAIERFALFTLTDAAEQDDDCARIYNKSLLYLISDAFEERFRIPILRPDGEPLLGMETFIQKDPIVKQMIDNGKIAHVRAPNTIAPGSPNASTARGHGAFDDDGPTIRATLARVLQQGAPEIAAFSHTAQFRRDQRQRLFV